MNERVEGQEMDSNYSTEEYRSHGSTASNSSLRFFIRRGIIKMEFMKIDCRMEGERSDLTWFILDKLDKASSRFLDISEVIIHSFL